MRGENDDRGRSPAEVVSELMAAICDSRIEDMLALVHPQVMWLPVGRPGLTLYEGHAGMIRLVEDLSAAYGRFRLEVTEITAGTGKQAAAESGTQVTVRARVVRESEGADLAPLPITSVFTLRGGLVTSMDGEPGDPAAPDKGVPGIEQKDNFEAQSSPVTCRSAAEAIGGGWAAGHGLHASRPWASLIRAVGVTAASHGDVIPDQAPQRREWVMVAV
jgi:SnoaL-like domain